jgi:hypothetical protein
MGDIVVLYDIVILYGTVIVNTVILYDMSHFSFCTVPMTLFSPVLRNGATYSTEFMFYSFAASLLLWFFL